MSAFRNLKDIEGVSAMSAGIGSAQWPSNQTAQPQSGSYTLQSHSETCAACNEMLGPLGFCEPCLYRDIDSDNAMGGGRDLDSSLGEWDNGISETL